MPKMQITHPANMALGILGQNLDVVRLEELVL